MSVFGYLKRKLKKGIESGKPQSDADEEYKGERKRQQKEMLMEVREKHRVKRGRIGRRVSERKGVDKRVNYPFDKRIDDTTLKSAQYIAKTKANAVRVEEVYEEEDNTHVYFFYDSNNDQVATYILEEKRFFYSDREQQKKVIGGKLEKEQSITRAEQEDPGFQPFIKKLVKHRFPDVPSLLSIKIRREIGDELPPNSAGISVPYRQVSDVGANIIVNRDEKGSDLNMVLTHELTHERRRSAGEFKPYDTEADKEEVETEMESIQRGSIVDYGRGRYGDIGGYWGALGRHWRIWQKQDYETLTKRKVPRDYFELVIPSTKKISSNISLRKRDTNFWNVAIRKGGLEKIIGSMIEDGNEEDKAIPRIISHKRRTKNMITGRAENIDMSFITSEGDYLHSFSPTGKAKPIDVARFLDRSDKITGEEDVWQIMDVGKRLLISDKATPDRIVRKPLKKTKRHQKKQKPYGFIPKFKPLDIPTFNLPYIEVKKVKQKTQKKKKAKKGKDPIKDVLSFIFLK